MAFIRKYLLKSSFILKIMLLALGECALEAFQKYRHDNDVKSLSDCIFDIMQKEKASKSSTMIIKTGNDITDGIEDILTNKGVPIIVTDKSNFEKNIDAYNDSNILAIITFEKCEDLFVFNFAELTRDNIKYLMNVNNFTDACANILGKKGRTINTVNVNVIIKGEGEFKIYTFMPIINEKTCTFKSDNESLHVNTCKNGKLENNIAFPVKTSKDFKGCEVNIGLTTLYPFAMYDNKTQLKMYDPITSARGSDVDILNIIAKYLNASIKYHRVFRNFANDRQMDSKFFLLNGSLDVLAGGMFRSYGDIVEYSGTYQTQTIVWLYSVERKQRSWENFARKLNGLYYFLIFYFIYCAIWNLCSYFDGENVSINTTLLKAWGALVATSLLQDARSIKQRILNMSYLIMCIYLSVFISAQMYSFLTISAPPEMFKTNEELMNSGRTPYLQPKIKYFVKDSQYTKFAETSKDCDDYLDCEVKTLNEKGVTVVTDGHLYPFQLDTAKDDEARVLRVPENIVTVFREMVLRKGSPIVKNFQKAMARLFEAGICKKLYLEAIGISRVARANKANENVKHNSYSCKTGCSVTLAQAAGAFYVWLLGCVISCCVFIGEIIVKRRRN